MTIYAAYALMLLVPVLLTVAVIGLPALFLHIPLVGPGYGMFVFVLLAVLWIVGIPYVIMTIGLVFWAQGRPAPAVRRAANLAPVILWLLVLLWWGIIWLNRGLENPPFPRESMPGLFGWMSALVLGMGYLWVMLAHRVVRWLTRRQFVADAA